MKNLCPNPNSPEWKKILEATDGDEKEAFKIWNKDFELFNDKLETNDDSEFYEDGHSIYYRISSVLNNLFNVKKFTFAERAKYHFEKNPDNNGTISFYNVFTTKRENFTEDNLALHLEEVNNQARNKGKVVHKLIETTGRFSLASAKQSLKTLTDASYNEAVTIYKALKDSSKFSYEVSDVVEREKTISLDLELNIDGKLVNGLAGTIDEFVRHEDGTFSTRDFKTGALSTKEFGTMLAKYGKGIEGSSVNKAKLQQTMYVLMMKLKDPTMTFKAIEILKLPSTDEVQQLTYDIASELNVFLPVIKAYLKDKATNYNLSDEFFDAKNYVTKNTKLASKIISMANANPDLNMGEVKLKLRDNLLMRLDESMRTVAKLKAKTKLSDAEINILNSKEAYNVELQQQIEELLTGYNSIKTGEYRKSTNYLSAVISDKYHATNSLARAFIKLFNIGIDRYNKYMTDFRDEYMMPKSSKSADYKEEYKWFWDGGDIVTYKSDKWNELTKEQKEYADYYRWTMRYELFKTMNPAVGLRYMKDELKERTTYDGLNKEMLEQQIAVMNENVSYVGGIPSSFNKLDGYFEYYEGWTFRLGKSKEEKTMKEYWLNTNKFELTGEELKEIEKGKQAETLQQQGIKIDINSAGAAGQLNGIYTYNPTIILGHHIKRIVKKRFFDDVINFGTSINNFLHEEDKRNNTTFYANVEKYIKNVIDSAILHKKTVTELPSFKAMRNKKNQVTGEIERVQVTYSMDKIAIAAKDYFSFVIMAFQPLASIRRGISGTINLSVHSMSNTLSSFVGVEEIDFTVRDAASSVDVFWKKDEKTRKMVELFGFLPDNYDDGTSSNSLIKTADPYFTKNLEKAGFAIDRFVDNANFMITMIAQLKAMKLANGKTMWESYEIVDKKLVYTGGVRGIDVDTSQEIKELTSAEINKLKAVSTKMYGAYRAEERAGFEISTIGALIGQFKKFVVPIYTAAFGQPYTSEDLGRYIETGEVEGIKQLKWEARHEEGFIITALSVAVTIIQLHNVKDIKEYLKELNPQQKRNLMLALTKGMLFFVLTKIVSLLFGDSDDDDKNKIKQLFNLIKREIITEFNIADTLRTISSVPTVTRLYDVISGGHALLIDSIIQGERIESGKFKNGYFGETIPPVKGIPQLLKNLPITASIWNIYNQWMDFENLEETIRNDTYLK